MKFLCYLCRCYGSYENTSGGLTNWALQDLTGGVTENHQVYENPRLIQRLLDVSMTNASLVGTYISVRTYTLKHSYYSEYAYNEFTLKTKLFSFPVTLLHAVNLTGITNYVFNEVKLPVSGTSL